MPEAGRFERGWSLFTLSIRLLREHKVLILFPLLGLVFIALFAILFFVPELLQGRDTSPSAFALFYLLLMFFSTFTNVAFTHEAMQAFSGDGVSFRRGFSFARRRLLAILLWSLFAGLVGLAIARLEQHFGLFGRIVMKFVGMGWSIASIFAIPVMIREPSDNPIQLLRKSAATLRRSWGDTLVGYVGVNLVVSLAVGTILGLGIVFTIAFLSPVPTSWLPILGVAVGALFLVATLISGAIDALFRSALYIYATEGVVPEPYSRELLDSAWRVRKE